VSHDGGVWQLDARKFVVGSSQLGGEFNLDTRAKPPLLKGELRGQRLFLSDLGPSIGVDSQSTGSAETPAGQRVLPNTKLDIPSLTAMNATVKVDIDKFDLDTKALAPLSKLQSELVLQDGSLALNDLRAIAPEGTLTGTTRLEGRGAAALWSADLALSGVELARWLLVKRTEPDGPPRPQPDSSATAPPQAYLTGKLAARLIVSGKGRSTAEILASMNGQADLSVRDGTVSHLVIEAFGLDLAQGLGLLLSGDDALPMRCMRLQVAVNDGVAMVQRGVLDNSDSTLVLTGGLSLRDETLNLKAVAKPKDMSLFTLRSPLRVTGSWSTPSIALEGDKLAARALAAVVLGSLAGPAALLPFVDLGTDSDTDPCIRTRSDL
jgi:AsmA family protein